MSHSEVQELLAGWREALRECEQAEPGPDAWSTAHARAVDLSVKDRGAPDEGAPRSRHQSARGVLQMTAISGGVNIAMKVPAHQYEAVVAFYRETLGCEEIAGGDDISFRFGPNRLWIDRVSQMSQAEIWLELVTR